MARVGGGSASRPVRWWFAVAWPALAGCVAFVAFVDVGTAIAVATGSTVTLSSDLSLPARGLLAGLVVGMCLGWRWVDSDQALAVAAPFMSGVGAILGCLVLRASWLAPNILIGPTAPMSAIAVLLAAAVGLGSAFAVRRGFSAAVSVLAITVLLIALAWSAGLFPGLIGNQHAAEMGQFQATLASGKFGFDGTMYLNTLQRMIAGQPYFSAFSAARSLQTGAREGFMTSVFNYRERWLFEFWKLLPHPGFRTVWNAYITLALVTVVIAYLIGLRFLGPGLALLGPILVGSYYVGHAWKNYWMFMELWASMLLIAVLWALLTRRWALSSVLLVAAVAVRELSVLLMPAWIIAWWFAPRRRSRIISMLVVLIGPLMVLAYQVLSVPVHRGGGFSLASWLNGGIHAWTVTLSFGEALLPLGTPLLLGGVALAIAAAFSLKPRWRMLAIVTAVGVPATFMFVFAGPQIVTEYWGGLVIPVTLTLAPLVCCFFWPSDRLELDRLTVGKPVRKVRFVVPTHNAEASVGETLDAIVGAMKGSKHSYAVLVIDDASDDATTSVARRYVGRMPLTVATNEHHLGSGATLVRGLKAAGTASKDADVVISVLPDMAVDSS